MGTTHHALIEAFSPGLPRDSSKYMLSKVIEKADENDDQQDGDQSDKEPM